MSAPAIAAFDLAKNFGDTHALQGLDLQVEEGQIVGCLGPNGAGKTTMIRLLLGLLVPSRGRARPSRHTGDWRTYPARPTSGLR
jgi:ABC-2 type transport system ATP-binding protein